MLRFFFLHQHDVVSSTPPAELQCFGHVVFSRSFAKSLYRNRLFTARPKSIPPYYETCHNVSFGLRFYISVRDVAERRRPRVSSLKPNSENYTYTTCTAPRARHRRHCTVTRHKRTDDLWSLVSGHLRDRFYRVRTTYRVSRNDSSDFKESRLHNAVTDFAIRQDHLEGNVRKRCFSSNPEGKNYSVAVRRTGRPRTKRDVIRTAATYPSLRCTLSRLGAKYHELQVSTICLLKSDE